MSDIRVEGTGPHVDREAIERRALEVAWPELESLDEFPVPPFPVDALPEPLAPWVDAVSESLQAPADMCALLGLAACASKLAGYVSISPRQGFEEPLNLYVAAVMGPANRKSPVFKAAFRVIQEIERERIEVMRPSVAIEKTQRDIVEKRLAEAKKMAAGRGSEESIADARRTAEELTRQLANWPVPDLPCDLVTDVTSEKLTMLLKQNGERMLVASDEGGLFDVMAGRYGGGIPDLEIYLKAHTGERVAVHRVGRESVELNSPKMTLAFAVQPEVMRTLGSERRFRGQGLLGRFLYAVPPSRIGQRRVVDLPVPQELRDAYAATIHSLNHLAYHVGPGSPKFVLPLDDGARRILNDFEEWVECELGNGCLESMHDWGGKLVGATLRIAGICHSVLHQGAAARHHAVCHGTIEAATRIARWAIPHAQAAMMLTSQGPAAQAMEDARFIVRKLQQRSPVPETVTQREIQRMCNQRFDTDKARLEEAIMRLQDGNYLGSTEAGRAGSRKFQVSPRLR